MTTGRLVTFCFDFFVVYHDNSAHLSVCLSSLGLLRILIYCDLDCIDVSNLKALRHWPVMARVLMPLKIQAQ